jgi:5-methylthioadenosine/S-adenosylhomocysteine deaminase
MKKDERLDCDLIICGSHVVTMNNEEQVLEDAAVVVKQGKIVEIGTKNTIINKYKPKELLDVAESIVMPGLINTHTHVAMTLFRGLADDTDLGSFLDKVWAAETNYITPESVAVGANLGFAEMLLAGVTCCADMYWFPESTAQCAKQIGIRLFAGEVFVDFLGADHISQWDTRIERAENFIATYKNDDLVTPILCPHATYTVSEEHLAALAALAKKHDVAVHIHASEAEFEMDTVKKITGKTPIQVLESAGLLNEKTWIAHGVHVSKEDRDTLIMRNTKVAHCPASNMKLASGTAPVCDYLNESITVSLGTDGPSSSNDLNPWMAMRLASLLQKNSNNDALALPAKEVVKMATRYGANTLSVSDKIGQLAPGMLADIIVVQCNKPHAQPIYDVYSHLVYSARPDDVHSVVVNGKVVVNNRRLVNLNLHEVSKKMHEIKTAIYSNISTPAQG